MLRCAGATCGTRRRRTAHPYAPMRRMALRGQANVRRAEDVRVGVVQQALARARLCGSDVWDVSQAPDPHACTQPNAADDHAVLVARLLRRQPRVRRRASVAGR